MALRNLQTAPFLQMYQYFEATVKDNPNLTNWVILSEPVLTTA